MKEGWKKLILRDVCTITMGQSPDSSSYNTEKNGLPFFQGCAEFGKINPIVKNYCSQPKKIAEANDILMSVRAPIGTLNIADRKCCIGRGLASFRALETISGTKFIYYFLFAHNEDLQNEGTGATFKAIGKDVIINFPISLPPLSEQQQIVEELDLLSGIIEKKKEQLKELDNLAQSIFYEMFGDPVANEKGWERAKLKNNVHEMFLGPFGSALKVDSYVSKENAYCMVYEQKHAIQKNINLERHYISREKFDSLSRFEVKPGDFIMSCRGTIGKIYEIPQGSPKGIIHPSLMKIRIKNEVYNHTYFLFMLTKIVANEDTNGNCVQMAITAKELGNKEVILPPLPLQQSFASKIEAIEKQKALIKHSITETETLFNSRMDYYFG